MKVRAIVDWANYKLVDRTTGKARIKGEEFEVTKKRLEELEAFPYKLVEEVVESISNNTSVEPRKTVKKSSRKHTEKK